MVKGNPIPVKMNGKNYMGRYFHLKHFVEGQGLGGHLDGTLTKPTEDKDEKAKAT